MRPSALRRGVAVVCVTAGIASIAAAAVAQMSTTPIPDGKALYASKCATCHGAMGMGDGPAGALLRVPPRDFTRGIYRFRSTSSGSLPTDEDLMKVVADGIPGTSMIGWTDLLSDAERRAVVARIKTFSPRFTTETPRPVSLAPEVPSSPASVDAGRQVYANLQCGACHGESGRVDTAVASALQDDWGHTVTVAKLTEPWTFKGGSSARELALRIKTGIDGTPMPGVADLATDTDLWNLAHYVRTLARKPVWEMNADELKSHYAQVDGARAASPVERGGQLAEVCAHCHSPIDKDSRIIPGMTFAGGQRMTLSVWGDRITANLTSDKDTGLGAYTDAEILKAVTRGIKRDGSRMLPFPMGWSAWAHLSDADQQALVAFLRTIPPVRNRITAPTKPGFVTYLIDKFRMLILGADDPILIHSGNAGALSEGQVRQ